MSQVSDIRREMMAVLEYNPETGDFFWKIRQGRQSAGSLAGSVRKPWPHIQIRVFNKIYRAHRLAWLFMTGEWPPEDMMLDHINRQCSDNRWVNLRLATPAENSTNQKMHSNNTSGHRGVYWHKASNLWQASVFSKGKARVLGYYKNKEDAVEARRAASAAHYGAFAPEPPVAP